MLHDKRTFLTAALALGMLCAASAAREPEKKADAKLEALWADLAGADEAKAARATLRLAASKDAVPFLSEHVKPVKVDAAAVAKLVKQLDSEDFETREKAGRELEYLGKFAKAVLEKHAAESGSAEVKRAIRVLIEKMPADETAPPKPPKIMGRSVSIRSGGGEIQIIIDGKPLDLTAYAPRLPPGPNMGWVRAARAVGVLEHLATPEARNLLEGMAAGEPAAPPTKAAKEALERLK